VIAHLRGTLIENDGETIVVDVAGVGYLVWVSAATLGVLPAVGAEVVLHIHSHFVSDEPTRLYGFADAGERRLFQTLIGVQGVGPRVALAILAGLPAGELVRAIAGSDVARLTQIKADRRAAREDRRRSHRRKGRRARAGHGAALGAARGAAGRCVRRADRARLQAGRVRGAARRDGSRATDRRAGQAGAGGLAEAMTDVSQATRR
jgi:hypothetical protein